MGGDRVKSDDWMTVDETAEYLGVSRELIYQEIRKGAFPALVIGDRRLVSKQGLVEAAVRAGSKVAQDD
jgi:excisionase family DNA binding protein